MGGRRDQQAALQARVAGLLPAGWCQSPAPLETPRCPDRTPEDGESNGREEFGKVTLFPHVLGEGFPAPASFFSLPTWGGQHPQQLVMHGLQFVRRMKGKGGEGMRNKLYLFGQHMPL